MIRLLSVLVDFFCAVRTVLNSNDLAHLNQAFSLGEAKKAALLGLLAIKCK